MNPFAAYYRPVATGVPLPSAPAPRAEPSAPAPTEAERRALCEACDDLDWVPEAKCVAAVGPRSCNPCRTEPWRKMARCPRGAWSRVQGVA